MGKLKFEITSDGISISTGKGKLSVPIDRVVKYCTTCHKEHPITEDGYEYLDCMLEMKKNEDKD